MGLEHIEPGRSVPNDINVVIEISANSDPVKYEVDKKSGMIMVDRFVATSMYYPCNYGFVPHTLSEDGDPVDVLVTSNAPHAVRMAAETGGREGRDGPIRGQGRQPRDVLPRDARCR